MPSVWVCAEMDVEMDFSDFTHVENLLCHRLVVKRPIYISCAKGGGGRGVSSYLTIWVVLHWICNYQYIILSRLWRAAPSDISKPDNFKSFILQKLLSQRVQIKVKAYKTTDYSCHEDFATNLWNQSILTKGEQFS